MATATLVQRPIATNPTHAGTDAEMSKSPTATVQELAGFLAQQAEHSADAESTAWAIIKHYALDASPADCPLRRSVAARLAQADGVPLV